ncbi:hypothetical protein P7K49_008772 [Saguinus oedipus]|uniref:Uncharacterized protein n=1 Tax=Saguinus oedipus TaxID=9490 RepID=A0ABQ9VYR1_SAGOE|nr:hypothetical protein P7K49_008772 [Saguinus oedipus]
MTTPGPKGPGASTAPQRPGGAVQPLAETARECFKDCSKSSEEQVPPWDSQDGFHWWRPWENRSAGHNSDTKCGREGQEMEQVFSASRRPCSGSHSPAEKPRAVKSERRLREAPAGPWTLRT